MWIFIETPPKNKVQQWTQFNISTLITRGSFLQPLYDICPVRPAITKHNQLLSKWNIYMQLNNTPVLDIFLTV